MSTVKELRDRAKALGIRGAGKMAKGELEERIKAAEAKEPAAEGKAGFTSATVTNESGGQVLVSRDGDTVTVRWLCGATRSFDVDDLAAALERFTSIGETRRLWFEDQDSRGRYWAAELRDGDFHGDDSVNGASGHVPWDEFKAALQASLQTPDERKDKVIT